MPDNSTPETNGSKKRNLFAQVEFPQLSLEDALRVPQAIWEHYAGHATKPLDVAVALKISPSSSNWRTLTGASAAYGLTKGGYNADVIELTDISRRIVAPKEPGDDLLAKREAMLKPRIIKTFLEKYNNARFPDENIAGNVLVNMGLPKDRAKNAVHLLRKNVRFVGIFKEASGSLYIDIDAVSLSRNAKDYTRVDKSENPQDIQEGSYRIPDDEQGLINNENDSGLSRSAQPTLHIDIQIHISPDSSAEQIDQIFASMAKHLYTKG